MNSRAQPRKRGARPGRPDTRHIVLDIARHRFFTDGYRAVTLRSLADEADVDVALISYYFGSKRGLFAAALDLPSNPPELLREALQGDPATLPERILRTLLATWDDARRGTALTVMLTTAVQEPSIGRLLRELVEREIIGTLIDHFGGAYARRKAAAMTHRYWDCCSPATCWRWNPSLPWTPMN